MPCSFSGIPAFSATSAACRAARGRRASSHFEDRRLLAALTLLAPWRLHSPKMANGGVTKKRSLATFAAQPARAGFIGRISSTPHTNVRLLRLLTGRNLALLLRAPSADGASAATHVGHGGPTLHSARHPEVYAGARMRYILGVSRSSQRGVLL